MEEFSRKTGVSKFLMVTLIVLAIIVAGGGVWYFMDKKASDKKAELQAQIDALTTQVASLKTASAPSATDTTATQVAPTTTNTTVADPTASWKTYSDTTYGFSFKYPANFSTSVDTGLPGGPEISISPTGKSLKVDSQSTSLFTFNWHQNVGEATTLADFAASISAASKANTTVGKYSAIKATNINKSSVDQVVFSANNTIGSFYSRVALLRANQVIAAAEATEYNNDFNLMIASFTLL